MAVHLDFVLILFSDELRDTSLLHFDQLYLFEAFKFASSGQVND